MTPPATRKDALERWSASVQRFDKLVSDYEDACSMLEEAFKLENEGLRSDEDLSSEEACTFNALN
jgi:hypothetical protein